MSGVAERGQVTHVGHVTGETVRAAEGGRLVLHALGQLIEAVSCSLVPLGLAGHLAVARLDSLFLHGQRSVDLRRAARELRQATKSSTDGVNSICIEGCSAGSSSLFTSS